jgi:tRNA-dihydrouridine synthase 1
MTANLDLNYIAAPMVNQSDTPFRALMHNHGATLTYTEMLRPARLLSDPDYLAFHRRSLELGRPSAGPVIVQVCGNDQDVILRGAKTVVDLCDGIGMCRPVQNIYYWFLSLSLSDAFPCEAAQI